MRNVRYKLQRVAESKVTKCFAEQRRVMSLAASGFNVHDRQEQPGEPGGGHRAEHPLGIHGEFRLEQKARDLCL